MSNRCFEVKKIDGREYLLVPVESANEIIGNGELGIEMLVGNHRIRLLGATEYHVESVDESFPLGFGDNTVFALVDNGVRLKIVKT